MFWRGNFDQFYLWVHKLIQSDSICKKIKQMTTKLHLELVTYLQKRERYDKMVLIFPFKKKIGAFSQKLLFWRQFWSWTLRVNFIEKNLENVLQSISLKKNFEMFLENSKKNLLSKKKKKSYGKFDNFSRKIRHNLSLGFDVPVKNIAKNNVF